MYLLAICSFYAKQQSVRGQSFALPGRTLKNALSAPPPPRVDFDIRRYTCNRVVDLSVQFRLRVELYEIFLWAPQQPHNLIFILIGVHPISFFLKKKKLKS